MVLATKFQFILKLLFKNIVIGYQLENYHFFKEDDTRNDLDYLSILQCFSKCPEGTARCINLIKQEIELYDLQIIIPVYNVEKYLCECVDSIINQSTKYNIIIYLVDDGSVDNCPKICDQYAEKDKRIKVIHKSNGGVSSARNEGIKEMVAKYIMFMDSDDRLIDGSLDKLMDIAYSQNADIVQGTICGLRNGVHTARYGFKKTKKTDYSKLTGFPVAKVFRNELFKDLCFPENFWFEDTIDSFLIYPKSNCTWGLSDVVYEYRVNNTGYTSQVHRNSKSLDSFWITRMLIKEREEYGHPNDLKYFQKLKTQVITNHLRLSSVPDNIKEAVFNLSANCIIEVFSHIDDLGALTKSDLLFDKMLRDRNYKLFSKMVKWL